MESSRCAHPFRAVLEWALYSNVAYDSPFTDVAVQGEFCSPAGKTWIVPGFYDGETPAGEGIWRVRFDPGEAGNWSVRFSAYPANAQLAGEALFEVAENPGVKGFLCATPQKGWGLSYESGESLFVMGDTVYNLFGMAHCGLDVDSFLERRASQGFNLLRVRLPVSPFHPPRGYNTWQTRRTWPWGGSEQAPQFDRFNLEYFHNVDTVVQKAEALGMGLEMIMEGWGFEFPFNSRGIFTPEWEELWMRYLIARYDAYNSVYLWTLMNEYEFYPNGDWHYKPVADRWAMRVGHWVRRTAPHGHILAVHNGPREPAFAQRFASDPQAIDCIMFQDWGTRGAEDGWLALGIEDQIERSLKGWWGSAVFAEWGYERNPEFELLLPSHQYCDPDHTRRGAWRGAFCGLGLIHGFENSWGPWGELGQDQPGLIYLQFLKRFFTQIVRFEQLRPAPEMVLPDDWKKGSRPLALAASDRSVICVYFPTAGQVRLALPPDRVYQAQWYDPCSGNLTNAQAVTPGVYAATERGSQPERSADSVLLLTR